MAHADDGRLTIGTLSAATGVPAETIRTWERRYGFPVPDRKASGHRVYALETVPRLRRIAQAITAGHRPAEVMQASEAALDALLATVPLPRPVAVPAAAGAAPAADPDDLLAAARRYDADLLRHSFQTDWARLGPLEFLERRAARFLVLLGDRWAQGTLDVRHEHFASTCLGDFLRTVRAPLDERATGPIAVLATLPGERHGVGLQMAAVVFVLRGWRALVLGVDTPAEQITALGSEVPLRAVALSLVRRRPLRDVVGPVDSIRRALPRGVPLLLGGAGAAPLRTKASHVFQDLRALDGWLAARAIA